MLLWVLQLQERCDKRSSFGASTLDVLYRIMPLPSLLLLIGCQMLEHNGCMFGTAVIRKCTFHMFASSCIIPELFSILQYAAGIYLCILGYFSASLIQFGLFLSTVRGQHKNCCTCAVDQIRSVVVALC